MFTPDQWIRLSHSSLLSLRRQFEDEARREQPLHNAIFYSQSPDPPAFREPPTSSIFDAPMLMRPLIPGTNISVTNIS
jgi:hypothetical protein